MLLQVVRRGEPAWFKIRQAFGESVIQENGELDRDNLGQIIFSDTQKRQVLNRIVHPQVQKKIIYRLFKFFITGMYFLFVTPFERDVPNELGVEKVGHKY